MQTGLVFKDGKIISHRSYRKIFLNPILRTFFGKAIGSIIADEKFIGYKLINQKEPTGWSFKIDFDYDYIRQIEK